MAPITSRIGDNGRAHYLMPRTAEQGLRTSSRAHYLMPRTAEQGLRTSSGVDVPSKIPLPTLGPLPAPSPQVGVHGLQNLIGVMGDSVAGPTQEHGPAATAIAVAQTQSP